MGAKKKEEKAEDPAMTQVRAVFADAYAIKHKWHAALSFEGNTCLCQPNAEWRFVRALEQSRTQLPVNSNRTADDAFRERISVVHTASMKHAAYPKDSGAS